MRHAELRQQDGVARHATRRLDHQPVMHRHVAGVERGQRSRGQPRRQGHAGGEFGRHRIQRGLECGEQADVPVRRRGFLDRRFVRLQHRDRQGRGAGFDARTEGGAGEQDALRAGAMGVARQGQEPFAHRGGQAPVARQVGRQAGVQQAHQRGFRPQPGKSGFHRRRAVAQRVDQGNPHAGRQRRSTDGNSRQPGKAISSGPRLRTRSRSGLLSQLKPASGAGRLLKLPPLAP